MSFMQGQEGVRSQGVAHDIYAANTACIVPENIHTCTSPKEGFFLRSLTPLEIFISSVEESIDIFWQNSFHNGKQGNGQTKGSSYFAIIQESGVGNMWFQSVPSNQNSHSSNCNTFHTGLCKIAKHLFLQVSCQ